MANMKTDDSGVITTEFYTGRCPVRCEMCFVNFGMNGSSVPFTIYGEKQAGNFAYAACQSTLERLRKDGKPKRGLPGRLDWVEKLLCGPAEYSGSNNEPRLWEPVTGVDRRTGEEVLFWSGMTKSDFKNILKPQEDDQGLYSIPKVPEQPWFMHIPATRVYNGQWLPSVLRANSMSDSSVAPSEWIGRLREIWGDSCFFNTNIHAIKRFPANMKAGLYHKVVVTANPGLQKNHIGLNRYLTWYRKQADVALDPRVAQVAMEAFPNEDFGGDIEHWLSKQSWETLYGLVTLALGAGTMKGEGRRSEWHFFNPAMISDIHGGAFAKYEKNIKFYRVRALPTIQPRVEKFGDIPVVYTVLRFKTVAQACEFANKYDIETRCVVASWKDKLVCDYYGIPSRMTEDEEQTVVEMRDNTAMNGSPNRGEWSQLYWEHNFFRAGKSQMGNMRYVCDRASKSCKACGLCAMLDGSEEGGCNPVLASLGLYPKEYGEQDRYLCDSEGNPLPTMGVVGKATRRQYDLTPTEFGIGRTQSEMDYFYGEGLKKFWSPEEAERSRKARERQAGRERGTDEYEEVAEDLEQNPGFIVEVDEDIPGEVGEPAQGMLAMLEAFDGRRQNPSDDELLLETMRDTLRLAADYGTQTENYWWQGWNTHEDVATMVAKVYWRLMVMAHQDGLNEDQAAEAARKFSYKACGVDMFEEDFVELSLMFHNRSYWNDEFGPTW